MGMTSLGKEWKGIKRELDKVRRAAKKEAERKAEAEIREKGFGGSRRFVGRDGEVDAYSRGPAPSRYDRGGRRDDFGGGGRRPNYDEGRNSRFGGDGGARRGHHR